MCKHVIFIQRSKFISFYKDTYNGILPVDFPFFFCFSNYLANNNGNNANSNYNKLAWIYIYFKWSWHINLDFIGSFNKSIH